MIAMEDQQHEQCDCKNRITYDLPDIDFIDISKRFESTVVNHWHLVTIRQQSVYPNLLRSCTWIEDIALIDGVDYYNIMFVDSTGTAKLRYRVVTDVREAQIREEVIARKGDERDVGKLNDTQLLQFYANTLTK